jgi:hypothetical protein
VNIDRFYEGAPIIPAMRYCDGRMSKLRPSFQGEHHWCTIAWWIYIDVLAGFP